MLEKVLAVLIILGIVLLLVFVDTFLKVSIIKWIW